MRNFGKLVLGCIEADFARKYSFLRRDLHLLPTFSQLLRGAASSCGSRVPVFPRRVSGPVCCFGEVQRRKEKVEHDEVLNGKHRVRFYILR